MLRAIAISLLLCQPPIFPQNPGPSVSGAGRSNVTPITYTGNNCGVYNGSGASTSATCTITVANTGDTLLAFLLANGSGAYSSATIACGSATSLRSETYSSWRYTIVYVPNASSGSCSFKLSLASSNYVSMQVLDFAGANTATPIDNANCTATPYCSASATSTAPSATIQTSNSNEMLVPFLVAQGGTVTPGSGYVYVANTYVTNESQGAEYGLATSAGSHSPNYSLSTSALWAESVVALTK